VLVVNRLPGRRELGRDRWPVPAAAAAPALLSDGRDGFPPGRFYVQGVVVDAKSPSGRLAVTNGILVEWTP